MSGLRLDVPAELVRKYATSAPRYTSYPTAVDWTGDGRRETYENHLRQGAASTDPLSVYVHVPFCEALCLYCGCNVHITRNHGKGQTYVEHIERELALLAQTGIGQRPFTQMHWGGGTPTFLTPDELARLHGAVASVFAPTSDAEIGIEVDPRVTTDAHLKRLASLGFNRLSLGIQDFDDAVQQEVRRVQSIEQTRRVVEVGRSEGFDSVNVDLMYGLPRQTPEGFFRTIDEVLLLRPDRIALFQYAHVPWMKKHQTAMDLATCPSSETKLSIFLEAVARFTDHGYVYLGLDHFARPEDELARAKADRTLQRNFMGYGTRAGADMIGLGVSAIGEMDGGFFQNNPDLASWSDHLSNGRLATKKCHVASDDDRLRRRVILNLMCHSVVVKAEIEREFPIVFDQFFQTELQDLMPLAQDGLVLILPDRLEVPPIGQIFLRNIAVVFDRYYRTRHHRDGAPASTFSRTF